MVAGFDATIRSSPVPEAKLITVGESPMIALYKVTKVGLHNCALCEAVVHTLTHTHTHALTHTLTVTQDAGHINVSEVMQVMASKMTSAVLGRLSKAG